MTLTPYAAAKFVGITTALSIFAVDAIAVDSGDFVRYALTQGGLLAVVLVLLWSIRKDALALYANKDDRITVLTDLVRESTIAQTKSADAQLAMARAMEEMTRTVSQVSMLRGGAH